MLVEKDAQTTETAAVNFVPTLGKTLVTGPAGDEDLILYDLQGRRVSNNTDGSIVGYKYFNFDAKRLATKANLMFVLSLIPEGVDGTIEIMQDRPWTSQGGKKIGEIHLLADMEKKVWDIAAGIRNEIKEKSLAGKHALFFVFHSDTKEKSLCTLENFYFTFDVK